MIVALDNENQIIFGIRFPAQFPYCLFCQLIWVMLTRILFTIGKCFLTCISFNHFYSLSLGSLSNMFILHITVSPFHRPLFEFQYLVIGTALLHNRIPMMKLWKLECTSLKLIPNSIKY